MWKNTKNIREINKMVYGQMNVKRFHYKTIQEKCVLCGLKYLNSSMQWITSHNSISNVEM